MKKKDCVKCERYEKWDQECCSCLERQLDIERAENEELKKDKARLDWIQENVAEAFIRDMRIVQGADDESCSFERTPWRARTVVKMQFKEGKTIREAIDLDMKGG